MSTLHVMWYERQKCTYTLLTHIILIKSKQSIEFVEAFHLLYFIELKNKKWWTGITSKPHINQYESTFYESTNLINILSDAIFFVSLNFNLGTFSLSYIPISHFITYHYFSHLLPIDDITDILILCILFCVIYKK